MKARILVLGADHGIGARIIAALESSEWATPVTCDVPQLSPEALGQADGIVNCTGGNAASIRACARAIFSLLGRASAQLRIVHLSSMTIYGAADGDVAETAEPSGDLGAYAAAHLEAERLARDYAQSVILRPGCEYGPGCRQWSERVARWLIERRMGDLGSAGDGRCNLLYVDDLVAAVIASLKLPDIAGQVFNLAMSSPPTWNQYFELFAGALGATPVARIGRQRLMLETKLLAAPLKVLEILAQRLRVARPLIPPPIPPSVATLCRRHLRLDVTKAEAAFGIQWTPLDQGVQMAAAAFRSSRPHFKPRSQVTIR
ncbi:MAG: SDR family oxidoreductase [Pseudomonadota bacterium]|nr:SDR family oxidoreductase [Pseudomonadota bacterium]